MPFYNDWNRVNLLNKLVVVNLAARFVEMTFGNGGFVKMCLGFLRFAIVVVIQYVIFACRES